MGLFSKILKTAVDVTLLPVDVARDVVTLGGLSEGKDKPNTVSRLSKIRCDGERIYEELEEE